MGFGQEWVERNTEVKMMLELVFYGAANPVYIKQACEVCTAETPEMVSSDAQRHGTVGLARTSGCGIFPPQSAVETEKSRKTEIYCGISLHFPDFVVVNSLGMMYNAIG